MSGKNIFDDVVSLAARLPWWLGMGCDLLPYLLLHPYSLQPGGDSAKHALVVSLDQDEERSMKRVRVKKSKKEIDER